jgi:ribosome maturation protein Sdo1
MAAFGTEDIDVVIGIVLDKGEIQLSAEERDQKQDR